MKLKFLTTPYPHQLKAVKRAVKQGNHAFFFEPRCGKTKAALDAVAVQHHRGQVQRVIVIAPLIALDVWVREVQTHLSVSAKVMQLGERPLYHRVNGARPQLQILLINYDKFSRRGEIYKYKNRFLNMVEKWGPDLMILDESHRVKSAGAVRSQALWRMVHRLREKRGDKPWVYLLTGTPHPKSYLDIFSQFRIMDDSLFGTNKLDFEDQYIIRGFGARRFSVVGYRNKPEMLTKIRAHATIVSQTQANLKGKEFFNPLHVELPTAARRAYNELAQELIAQINGEIVEASNPAVKRLRLLQITGGFLTDHTLVHRAKVEAAHDWLTDLVQQGEHVVVYARYLGEVEQMDEVCRKLGFHTQVIRGGVSRAARGQAIAKFQRATTSPHALVFQVEAGALAIELTNAAEVLFYSLPDSWESFYQATQRVQGPKQTRPVRHSFILAKNTVDQGVLDALRGKKDLHKELLRNPESFLFGL